MICSVDKGFPLDRVPNEPDNQPSPIVRLWPDSETGPFRLRLWFGRVDDRPAVVGVEMWGVHPVGAPWPGPVGMEPADSPIRAEDIRLPLGKLLDAWVERQYRYARASLTLWGDVPGQAERVEKFTAPLDGHSTERRVGRPALSDEMLSQVVEVYNAAVRRGDRQPAVRVFEELGPTYGAAVPETARGWVRQARRRWPDRVLPPTKARRL